MKGTNLLVGLVGATIATLTTFLMVGGSDGSELKLVQPKIGSIKNWSYIYGHIEPRSQVTIKAHLSGTILDIMVSVGQQVGKGDPIARIKVHPDPSQLQQAQAEVTMARIKLEKESQSFERARHLYRQRVISAEDYESVASVYQMARLEFETRTTQLEIILSGRQPNDDSPTNLVHSTISGIVLELPLEAGASVVRRNNYNEGTTVAVIADLEALVFSGTVPENDINNIKYGMPIEVRIPAWKERILEGFVDQISPRAQSLKGIRSFKVRIGLQTGLLQKPSCGVTGIGRFISSQVSDALLVEESNLHFSNDSAFVYLLQPETRKTVKTWVKTGLTDGIYTQIIEGLTLESRLLVLDQAFEISD